MGMHKRKYSLAIAKHCGAQLLIRTLYNWTELSGVQVFLIGFVMDCNLAHRRSDDLSINPMNPLNGALPLPYVQLQSFLLA